MIKGAFDTPQLTLSFPVLWTWYVSEQTQRSEHVGSPASRCDGQPYSPLHLERRLPCGCHVLSVAFSVRCILTTCLLLLCICESRLSVSFVYLAASVLLAWRYSVAIVRRSEAAGAKILILVLVLVLVCAPFRASLSVPSCSCCSMTQVLPSLCSSIPTRTACSANNSPMQSSRRQTLGTQSAVPSSHRPLASSSFPCQAKRMEGCIDCCTGKGS